MQRERQVLPAPMRIIKGPGTLSGFTSSHRLSFAFQISEFSELEGEEGL